MLMGDVGLFFYINGHFLVHGCDLQEAEKYGKFKIYQGSHFEVWDKCYVKTYHVDYDYYPRGRIVYDTEIEKYFVYRDACIPEEEICKFIEDRVGENYVLLLDEHYQCHGCNQVYVNLFEIFGNALLEE